MLNIFGLVTVSVSDSSRILQTNSLAGSFERKKPCVTFIIKTAGQHFVILLLFTLVRICIIICYVSMYNFSS